MYPVDHRAMRVVGIALVIVAATFVMGTNPAGAVSSKSATVLFVHGFSLSSPPSSDCGGDFDAMISQMRGEGFTGSMVKVGYYSGDVNCNVNLHSYGSYGDTDSWKSIAMAMSSYVYNTYTRYGVAVDVVGYSMGALVTRGAVYGAQSGAPGFSPPINVSDAVTLGGPHNGAAWYTYFCLWGQCASMTPGSTDLNWLNQNGNPQGSASTTWTNIGSYNDLVVPWQSATSMAIPADHKIVFANIDHTGSNNYMHNWSVVNRADSALTSVPGPIHSGINSAKCIDVNGSNTSNGTAVQIYDCNGTGAQIWTRSSSGDSLLTALGKCLDINGANTANGTKVQLYDCNTTNAQRWTISTSDHTIRGLGKCLDDPSGNVSNFTQLQIWDCNGSAGQRWY
jgi:hypothetical protein